MDRRSFVGMLVLGVGALPREAAALAPASAASSVSGAPIRATGSAIPWELKAAQVRDFARKIGRAAHLQ